MNNYKKTEYMLYNYKNFKAEIKNILLEIEEIENTYRGISAISYEEKSAPTNKITSSVEQEVELKESKIARLQDLILQKENNIARVDNALEALTDDEIELINKCYFEKRKVKDVAIELQVTDQTICRNKSILINKIAKLMFIE